MLSKNCLKVFAFYFYEHFERKIGYIFLFTSAVFLLLIMSLRVFDMNMPNKVIIDFSFSGIALINLILAFSITLTSVPSDIKNRYIYIMLSKPISRYDYLLGKFLSICGVIFINVFIMIVELILVTYSKEGIFEPNIIWAGFFIFLADAIIIAHIIFFSLFLPVSINTCLSITMVVVGNMTPVYLTYLGKEKAFLISYWISVFTKFLFPHLYYFDIKPAAMNNFFLPPAYVASTTMYGLIYIGFMLFLACWVLENKDL
jgi:ABC-type transport system involved in multi-copper enzyme maturation permease subunit